MLDIALLIARDEYPQIDAGSDAATIQGYADSVKPKSAPGAELPAMRESRSCSAYGQATNRSSAPGRSRADST